MNDGYHRPSEINSFPLLRILKSAMKKKPIEIPTTPEKPTVYPTEPPTPGPSRDPEVKPVVTPPVIIPEPEVPPPPSDLEKK